MGTVEKILGLAFLEGMLELGAVEEPEAIVEIKVEDEVKNKVFASLQRFCVQQGSLKAG